MISDMKKGKSWLYHQFLRSSALLFLGLLVFDSGFLSPLTKQLSDNTYDYVANVISVGAAVAPNELNMLTAELTAQKQVLDEKERQLDVALNNTNTSSSRNLSTYVLSVLLFIILVLITLNYALDYARERRRYNQPLKPSYE